MKILGVNAVFHDPAAALIIDGELVAAAEEERFTRRKHGKRPVPFSAWELPEQSIRWCLDFAGLSACDLDLVAYSYDPSLCMPAEELGIDDPWDHLRVTYAEQAPAFMVEALPGLKADQVRFVPHHIAHAASAALAGPGAMRSGKSAVLVTDGRGERASHLAGCYNANGFTTHASQRLPESLGLTYESLTEHLGFRRSCDEFKVMAFGAYGTPRFADDIAEFIHPAGDGFIAHPPDWSRWAPRRSPGQRGWEDAHADLAASVQKCVQDTLISMARWLREETGADRLCLAGGVALNCVANTMIWRDAGYDDVWVQPASGDDGTAIGAAAQLSLETGDARAVDFTTTALGRSWAPHEVGAILHDANVPFATPDDLPALAADTLARDGIVAWFDGRSEFGPRALGQRSLLAHPGREENLTRINEIKGREQFRPVAPVVLERRAGDVFEGGPLPSPYMTFVHDVRKEWRERVRAVTHIDGTARIQTLDSRSLPTLNDTLREFDRRTGIPLLINTSLNTAGRPIVDTPRQALELFASTPIDLLVLGPHVVRRNELFGSGRHGS